MTSSLGIPEVAYRRTTWLRSCAVKSIYYWTRDFGLGLNNLHNLHFGFESTLSCESCSCLDVTHNDETKDRWTLCSTSPFTRHLFGFLARVCPSVRLSRSWATPKRFSISKYVSHGTIERCCQFIDYIKAISQTQVLSSGVVCQREVAPLVDSENVIVIHNKLETVIFALSRMSALKRGHSV